MNLTILTQYYPPEIGAPQARLSELARRICERGHAVTILTAMPNYPTGRIQAGYGGLLRHETREGSRIVRTAIFPTQKAHFSHRMLNYLSFVGTSAVLGTFALPRADYLMVESPPLFLGLSGMWLSLVRHARMIFNVSDLWPASAVHLGVIRATGLSYRLAAWLEQVCYRRAWLITGQSRSILQDIEQRFPGSPTYHLSNGADVSRFHPDRRTPQAHAELATGNRLAVLYAGLHGLAQGLDQILDAARSLAAEDGFRFVLMGDGPEKPALMRYAQETGLQNVRFLPPRPSEEIPPYVASADVILITLKKHIPGAVPSKIYEAMASARPIVLVAEGEAADIVQDHRSGIVVRPGDTSGLVEALRSLQNQPDLRESLGKNGRRAAETHFNRDLIAAQFIDLLEHNL